MATVRTPENKNQLIIDEGAAETVRQIFSWKLDGMSAQAIADQLNSKGVLSPMEYKKSIGLNFKTSFKLNKMAKWTAVAVLRILKNELYIGTMVQGEKRRPITRSRPVFTSLRKSGAVLQTPMSRSYLQ